MTAYSAPVDSDGNARITAGDQYTNTTDHKLEWTDTGWDDLRVASTVITLNVVNKLGSTILTKVGDAVDADSCYIDLSEVESDIAPGDHTFTLTAQFDGNRMVTLKRGDFRVDPKAS